MSQPIANVDILTNNWELLVLKVNRLASVISTEALTGNSTYANTGNSTFAVTSQLYGTLGSNNLVVTDSLRGGNVNGLTAELPISSNVNITGSLVKIGNTTVNTSINTSSFSSANTTASILITRDTIDTSSANLNISANLVTFGDVTATGNGSFLGNSIRTLNYLIAETTNSDIGSNTTSPQVIDSYQISQFTSAKITVQCKNSSNTQTQLQEALVTHDGTTAEIVVYGTVASPAGANAFSTPLGDISANLNSGTVEILFQQTSPNSEARVVKKLLR
tara:strand:+ start:3635 stop:4465 length:831 start_codon:yes stop_codon:yes gene_type:complete